MYILYVAIFFVSMMGFASINNKASSLDPIASRAEVLAVNEIIYSNAVRTYVTSNPTATGTITDASLGLPTWYNNLGWTNNVTAAGVITIYPSNMAFLGNNKEIISALFEKSFNSQLVGIKKSGQFFNPVKGVNASITLPAAVPNEAPVYVIVTR